jgi:hypothetical protein
VGALLIAAVLIASCGSSHARTQSATSAPTAPSLDASGQYLASYVAEINSHEGGAPVQDRCLLFNGGVLVAFNGSGASTICARTPFSEAGMLWTSKAGSSWRGGHGSTSPACNLGSNKGDGYVYIDYPTASFQDKAGQVCRAFLEEGDWSSG